MPPNVVIIRYIRITHYYKATLRYNPKKDGVLLLKKVSIYAGKSPEISIKITS